jgi:hypothetical protein
VGVVEWLCAPLTDEDSMSRSRVNLMTNHMGLSR